MNKLTIALATAAATALAGCGRHDNGANTAGSSSDTSSQSTTAQSIPAPNSSNSSSTTAANNAPSTTAPGTTSPADSGATASTTPGSSTSPAAGTVASADSTAALGAGADAGKATFDKTCQVCHGAGVAGAPKVGDKADWGPRIAQGKDTLYKHALEGFQGKKGMMPPKGGNTALPDADVKAAVDYMVAQAK